MDEATPLPPHIEPILKALTNEVVQILYKWKLFKQLFGDESTVATLNRYAGPSFKIIEDTLWDDVVLSICRLADPPKMRGRSNLVFTSLIEALEADGDRATAGQIALDLQVFQARIPDLITWRHKRVAHNDLATTMARTAGASILTPIVAKTIREALEEAERMLNQVYGRHGIDFRFDGIAGGDPLVFAIERLAKYDRRNLAAEERP